MFHFRQALLRMRQGDSDREIAASKVMGRRKAAALRQVASARGWLGAAQALPEDAEIAQAMSAPRRAASTVSSLQPWRGLIGQWAAQGVSGVAMHSALKREHGFTGSYSAVRRLLADLRSSQPPAATVRLHFDPAEAAQVDFGAGPMLPDADGVIRRTWAFVMTLAFSRHQYVEFVWDQTVATWLGCHRRAFEWFGAVPQRLIIDNAKCAITRACRTEPTVQRAYAECAEGYGFRIDACPPREPQLKGIVEAGVKYVKINFLPLRTFRDLADLNAQARTWVMTEAGSRDHGTTRRKPRASSLMTVAGAWSRPGGSARAASSSLPNCSPIASSRSCAPPRACCAWPSRSPPLDSRPPAPGRSTTARPTTAPSRPSWPAAMTYASTPPPPSTPMPGTAAVPALPATLLISSARLPSTRLPRSPAGCIDAVPFTGDPR